jgi:coenzyme F420-0:L-glutamate ligase/coenzyme F420-1:gamma-L-glutamate ligase
LTVVEAPRGAHVEFVALPHFPLVQPGDDLAMLVLGSLSKAGLAIQRGDVLVVAQKIVSKAENRIVDLARVEPSPRALELASIVHKDPRLVQVILAESRRVVRARANVLIVEHRLGYVMANAGVDQSNVGPPDGIERVLMLPLDPDASARALREKLGKSCGIAPAVVINDSFGRAWRRGTVGVSIGVSGMPALVDMRGRPDLFGRPLRTTEIGFADEIAAAASLVMGQAAEASPVVLVHGLAVPSASGYATDVVRPARDDLFR